MSRREPYALPKPQDGAPIFWRSLEEKHAPGAAQERAQAEFPEGQLAGAAVARGADHKSLSRIANDPDDTTPVGRRGFMMLGGMLAALAAEGCARRPVEKVMPYVKQPEYAVPGLTYHFATVRAHRGDALGLIVESHEGRPTKIEGNPEHPGSLGATDGLTQASVFDLYDPDRTRVVLERGQPSTWADLEKWIATSVVPAAASGKVRLLVQPSLSPTFVRLRDLLRDKFPQLRVHTYTPVSDSAPREGARIAFGEVLAPLYDYGNARVIVAVDSDFLMTETGSVRATRAFARGRNVRSPHDTMSRLYVVEPEHTVTGANADHRLRLPAAHVQIYLYALAKELAARGVDLGDAGKAVVGAGADGIPDRWIKVVAAELAHPNNKGRSVVVVGSRQPKHLHALVHAINQGLGNVGQTVQLFPVADAAEADNLDDVKALAKDLNDGKVEKLLVLGGNPVHDAPADLKMGDAIAKAKEVFYLGSHVNETAAKATWHAPRAHELETWGDARSLDGTVSLQQPLIAPLHGGRSDVEILALLLSEPHPTGHELVQATLRVAMPGAVWFEKEWKRALQKGLVATIVPRPTAVTLRGAEIAAAMGAAKKAATITSGNLEVTFAPCPKLYDGRHANNPWLLELPNPMSKIVWDNVAFVSQTTARALGLENGDIVRLSKDGVGSVDIPVWTLPGQTDFSVALHLGWGRQAAGRYGNRHGFDVYPLRPADGMGFTDGVKLTKLAGDDLAKVKERVGEMGMSDHASPPLAGVAPYSQFEAETGRFKIIQTQEHHKMEGRPIAIDATFEEYKKTPTFPQYKSPDPKALPLWDRRPYNGYKWGLAIDLNACTGCNACVIACQAENNIATVGKEQVMRGREMHWLRIDRYFVGQDEADPVVAMQPVACVQCEEAPCENVCPVNATTHSPEGLNDMAYNRCVGTRYCANNCPYKVRRFNYLEYQGEPFYGDLPDTVKMQFNPNVTVRMRGVMEKCTYCVQRIQEAKATARVEGRQVRERDVTTACQQVCPAQAVVFGDLNDPTSRVTELTKRDRGYRLLAEVGTHPRTTHLGKIRNPNPEMGMQGGG
jgi:molybdopterin-containing oxidoreductase family iron-sulfur binding subunit